MKQFLLSVALVLGLSSTASAQVTEIRAGASVHDIDWTGLGSGSDKERSGAIVAEIIFEEPEILKWALTPQPYIGGQLNLGGRTSFASTGLLWRQTFAENFYLDYQFGLAIHDGTIEAEPSALVQSVASAGGTSGLTPAEAQQFLVDLADFRFRQQNEIDFGSRVLFQNQFSLGYRFNDNWSASIFANHLSHGKILAPDRPNEGLDTVGFRMARHF